MRYIVKCFLEIHIDYIGDASSTRLGISSENVTGLSSMILLLKTHDEMSQLPHIWQESLPLQSVSNDCNILSNSLMLIARNP